MLVQLRSRATTLQQYVWTAEQLEAVTLRIMRAEYPLDLRLMGVRYVFDSALCLYVLLCFATSYPFSSIYAPCGAAARPTAMHEEAHPLYVGSLCMAATDHEDAPLA